MKNFKKVVVEVNPEEVYSNLDRDIRQAINEYIEDKHQKALELYKQGRVADAQTILKYLGALMTFKVEYAEE